MNVLENKILKLIMNVIIIKVGGFSESLWLMDQHGIIIKRLISFPGNILIHNFQIERRKLCCILQNQMVTFEMNPSAPQLRLCENWLIRNQSIGTLELKNISSFTGNSQILSEGQSVLGSENNPHRLPLVDGVDMISNKFTLDNLGLIQDISVYNKNWVSILSKTEKSTRLLSFQISDLNQKFRERNRKLNQIVMNSEDSQLVVEEGMTAQISLEGLIHNVRDRQLEGAQLAFVLDSGFLVCFGVRVVFFSREMEIIRVWNFDSEVVSMCPVAFAKNSEVKTF